LLRRCLAQAPPSEREHEYQAGAREDRVRGTPARAANEGGADDHRPDGGSDAVPGVQEAHEATVLTERDGSVEPCVHPPGPRAGQDAPTEDDGPGGCDGDDQQAGRARDGRA
jgi:hypothetical protein